MHSLTLRPHTVGRCLHRVVEQGEKLSAALKLFSPQQVDMTAVFPQMGGRGVIAALCLPVFAVVQRGILAGLQTAVNGITVGVKIGQHNGLLIEKRF